LDVGRRDSLKLYFRIAARWHANRARIKKFENAETTLKLIGCT